MHSETPLQAAWTRIADLAARPSARHIRPLFADDPERARRFSASFEDLTLDFSKTSIDGETLVALLELVHAADLDGFRARLFAGEVVNPTEGRAAMHMALRSPRRCRHAGGAAGRHRTTPPPRRRRAGADAALRRQGARRAGCAAPPARRFDTVLNIGIGGSDLGPRMVAATR